MPKFRPGLPARLKDIAEKQVPVKLKLIVVVSCGGKDKEVGRFSAGGWRQMGYVKKVSFFKVHSALCFMAEQGKEI